MSQSLRERLEKNVWKRRPRECWPWLRALDKEGYAKFWLNKERGSLLAHTILYTLHYGEIPEGMRALTCPILKDCMNPHHIGVGTKDDIVDRALWRKGQKRRSPRKPCKKLSDEQVRQIYLSDTPTGEIAKEFGVAKSTVSNIRAGRERASATQFGEYHAYRLQDPRRAQYFEPGDTFPLGGGRFGPYGPPILQRWDDRYGGSHEPLRCEPWGATPGEFGRRVMAFAHLRVFGPTGQKRIW